MRKARFSRGRSEEEEEEEAKICCDVHLLEEEEEDMENDFSPDYMDLNSGAPASPELIYRRISKFEAQSATSIEVGGYSMSAMPNKLSAPPVAISHLSESIQLSSASSNLMLPQHEEQQDLNVVNPFFHSHACVDVVKAELTKVMIDLDFDCTDEPGQHVLNVLGLAMGEEVYFTIALEQDMYNGYSVIRINFELIRNTKEEFKFLYLFDQIRSRCSSIDDVELVTRRFELDEELEDEVIDEEFIDDLLTDITSCDYYSSREEAAKTLAQLCWHQSMRNFFIHQNKQTRFIEAIDSMIQDKEPIQRFALFCLSKFMMNDNSSSLLSNLNQSNIIKQVRNLQQQSVRTSIVKLAQRINIVC